VEGVGGFVEGFMEGLDTPDTIEPIPRKREIIKVTKGNPDMYIRKNLIFFRLPSI
jgi:hypothetical protein